MKIMPKKLFDRVIELSRQYWESGRTAILQERIDEAQKIEAITGLHWCAVLDTVDGIVQPKGLCPDAENDEIYCVLRCIGLEVTDEEQTSESL